MLNLAKINSRKRNSLFPFGYSNLWNSLLLFVLFFPEVQKLNAQSVQWAKSVGTTTPERSRSIFADPVTGDIYSTGSFEGTVDFDPGGGVFNLTALARDIFISKMDASGNFIWAKSMAGNEEYTSISEGASVTFDPIGNGSVYTTGYFSGEVDFDPGAGTFNLTATGGGDIFISRIDASGNFVWAKALVGNLNYSSIPEGTSIAFDPAEDGGVYTTGYFDGTVDFDPGAGIFNLTAPEYYYYSPCWDDDCYCFLACLVLESTTAMFISKLNSSGDFVWAKAWTATDETGDVTGLSIAIDTAGNGDVYTTGFFSDTIDFDPGAGVFYLAPTLYGFGTIFISKLDSSGDFVWALAMDGEGSGVGQSIAVAPGSGDIYTTGWYSGTIDFDSGENVFNLNSNGYQDIFISRIDNSGNFVWAKAMHAPSVGWGSGISLQVSPGSEAVYTTGYFTGTIDFNPGAGVFNLSSAGGFDIFISKLDNSGNFLWAKAAGGTGEDFGPSIALDATGSVIVTGSFQSPSITFDSVTLTNAGVSTFDIFFTKLGTCTNIVTNTSDSDIGSLRDVMSCCLSGSTITFSLPPSSQITLTSGEIIVNKNINLNAPANLNLTLSGNNASRIFHILPGKILDLENLSLKNATSSTNGGAVYVEGQLNLKNVIFQNNYENAMPKGLTVSGPGCMVNVHENVVIKN